MYAHPTLRVDPGILETGVVYYKKWGEKDVVLVKGHNGVIEIYEALDYEILVKAEAIS